MPAAKKTAGVKRKAPGRPPKATTRSSSAKSSSEESEDEVFFTTPSVEDVIQQALPHMVEALLPRITEQVSSQMAAQEHRSPPSQYQGSLPGQLRDRRDFDDEPMEEALQHHVRMITGERGGDDEDGAFSYNLTDVSYGGPMLRYSKTRYPRKWWPWRSSQLQNGYEFFRPSWWNTNGLSRRMP